MENVRKQKQMNMGMSNEVIYDQEGSRVGRIWEWGLRYGVIKPIVLIKECPLPRWTKLIVKLCTLA